MELRRKEMAVIRKARVKTWRQIKEMQKEARPSS
jgi:hypothetical protein